ncbi:MAG: YicC family protein [Gallionellaceae bacterium]|nr:YicC family protein [Gallionellaceae bacterium]
MICSMTGYAAVSAELDAGSLALELRAVNHRYLDLQIRLPDELRALESAMREALSAKLNRGKVECRVSFSPRHSQENFERLNLVALRQLAQWSSEIRGALPDARSLSVHEVLRWNGVLQGAGTTADSLQTAVMNLLQSALGDFTAAREREGEKLRAFLLQRAEQIEAFCATVAPRIPATVAAYEEKLNQRLRDLMHGNDDERLRQEIALFANRIDVDEELSRLRAHLTEVRRVLAQGGAVGKRLDFLMQELHREANTLGAKSADAEVSRASMEMKLLIEQMREQIQNLE